MSALRGVGCFGMFCAYLSNIDFGKALCQIRLAIQDDFPVLGDTQVFNQWRLSHQGFQGFR